MLGIAWVLLSVINWRTRSSFWGFVSVFVPVVGFPFLRDTSFPASGLIRDLYRIYGGAVVIAVGMLFFRVFRDRISRFCRLDCDGPIKGVQSGGE